MQTPLNTLQLSAFLHQHLNLSVASRALIDGHQAPLDYLSHVFFQGRGGFGAHGLPHPPRALDSVIWASRGGGKTFLGAVATALDLVFKPGIDIRILGGSLDQSRKMHAYLRKLFSDGPLAELVDGPIRDSRLALTNGSTVELLAQSHTSVRGTRVQTLRCDEVELFKEDVFDAAMLATKSKVIDIPGVGPTEIAGSIECMSTMHVPFGLMSRIVKDNTRRVFKWGVVDVLAECEPSRACSECELWSECRGRAKRVDVGCGMSDGGCEDGGTKAKDKQHGGPQRATEKEHGEDKGECGMKKKRGARNAECGAKKKGRAPKEAAKNGKAAKKTNPVRVSKYQRRAARTASEATGAVAKGAPKSRKHSERSNSGSSAPSSTSRKKKDARGMPQVQRDSEVPVAALAVRTVSEGSAGHLSIDDAVRMKRRVSLPVWNTEMLCLEPSRADTVFPEFDPRKHVFRDWEEEELFRCGEHSRSDPHTLQVASKTSPPPTPSLGEGAPEKGIARALPREFASVDEQAASLLFAKQEKDRKNCGELWVCGIDFGFRAPTVILWGAVEAHTRVLRILDERIVERATTKEHVEAIFKGNGRGWKLPDFVGVDPAGKQVNAQTGVRDSDVFGESGLDVKAKALGIGGGLHLIRARLAPAEGPVRLFVHVRCRGLIEALTKYHYRIDSPEDLEPVKDGSDHAVDALRYLVLNLDVAKEVTCKKYG